MHSVENGLVLDDILDELTELESLERHLIDLRIPFKKMLFIA